MKSINQQIHYILNKDVAVQKCMKRDLINTRALARELIEKHALTFTTDAVISAIRRYDLDEISLVDTKEANKLFAKMSIQTKDGVARIVLKEKAFKEISEDFLGKKALKENLRIVRGKETVTIIVNQKDLEKKIALFKPSDVIEIHKNLSEIRLNFPQSVDQIKGIFAKIATELALQDINIEEIMYSVPDWLVYVRDEDLVDAHASILKLKKN